MQTNYQRGRSGEYYLINILTEKGYKCIRSAGSHSPIDILAAKGHGWGGRLAIQAKKSEKNRMSADDTQKLIEWSEVFGAVPVEAFKENGKWVFMDISLMRPIVFDPYVHVVANLGLVLYFLGSLFDLVQTFHFM